MPARAWVEVGGPVLSDALRAHCRLLGARAGSTMSSTCPDDPRCASRSPQRGDRASTHAGGVNILGDIQRKVFAVNGNERGHCRRRCVLTAAFPPQSGSDDVEHQ